MVAPRSRPRSHRRVFLSWPSRSAGRDVLNSTVMARIGTLIRREIMQIVAASQRSLAGRVSKLAKYNRELRQVVRRQQLLIQSLRKRRRLSAATDDRGPASSMSASEVRELRSRLGLSRARLADLAGVSPGAIYLWETGRSAPRASSIERLRRAGAAGKTAPANGRKRRGRRAKAAANGRRRRGRPAKTAARRVAATARRPLAARRATGRRGGRRGRRSRA